MNSSIRHLFFLALLTVVITICPVFYLILQKNFSSPKVILRGAKGIRSIERSKKGSNVSIGKNCLSVGDVTGGHHAYDIFAAETTKIQYAKNVS